MEGYGNSISREGLLRGNELCLCYEDPVKSMPLEVILSPFHPILLSIKLSRAAFCIACGLSRNTEMWKDRRSVTVWLKCQRSEVCSVNDTE